MRLILLQERQPSTSWAKPMYSPAVSHRPTHWIMKWWWVPLQLNSQLCKNSHELQLLLPPFYSHYTGQRALASTPVKKWRILLKQSLTAHMALLTATSTFSSMVLPAPSPYHPHMNYN